jgi:hypothetical protein
MTTRILGLLLLGLSLGACQQETPEPAASTTPTTPPAGTLTVVRKGIVQPQGGVPSSGTVDLVRDTAGKEFLRFNADFMTDFHTGSLTIYLAKSAELIRVQRGRGAENVLSVGVITQSGAQVLAVPAASAGFSHVVLHCEPAQYNFGAAALQ